MENYEARAQEVGSGFDMNPSPGNIRDGLITDAIKSAGAATKGGRSAVADVLDYGEYVTREGLNLLCTQEMMWSLPQDWQVQEPI